MSLDFNIKQIQELISRDYRIPRFADFDINTDVNLLKNPEHISLKDLLLPLLKCLYATKAREAYLIDLVNYFTGRGVAYHYWDNPRKQKFVNEIRKIIPEVIDVQHYPPDSPNKKDRP